MMRWWLDRGVDGFRMDVINFISKAPGMPDAAPAPGQRYVNAFALFADGPRVHEYLAATTPARPCSGTPPSMPASHPASRGCR